VRVQLRAMAAFRGSIRPLRWPLLAQGLGRQCTRSLSAITADTSHVIAAAVRPADALVVFWAHKSIVRSHYSAILIGSVRHGEGLGRLAGFL